MDKSEPLEIRLCEADFRRWTYLRLEEQSKAISRLQGELMATEYLTVALITSHPNPATLNTIWDLVRTAAIDVEMAEDAAYGVPEVREGFHGRMALISKVTQSAKERSADGDD